MIEWRGEGTHLLLNPRMPLRERKRLEKLADTIPPLPAHVLIATSGSSGALKLTALSKEAMLVSAKAVNTHLESDARDVWCCVLPTFHVGGLGIYARAYLSNARVVELSWAADVFAVTCRAQSVTLASLVPAQVRDLVVSRLEAPPSLRTIAVGGGVLTDSLRDDARELGWPVVASYGMTECCSQIATALPGAAELQLLSHVEARTEIDGRLAIRSEALLTGYALFDDDAASFVDPKVDGWFITEDRVELDGRVLQVKGRVGELVKIGGESVDLVRLDRILEEISRDAALAPADDERLGCVIHLFVASGDEAAIAEAFNARVHPFERVRRVHRVEKIPRSPLGKLLRKQLVATLS